MSSNCLIIAGEKSGEDHGMTFLPELMKLKPNTKFFGVGGDKFSGLGIELLYHARDFSGIGLSEILSKVPFYYKALANILNEVDKRKVDTAILIDFQGFNLKLAKKLKKRGVNVLYYVAPQAWVWKPWRAKTLEQNVHTLFTILPFEKNWFQDRGVTKVKSVVHPLMIEYGERLKRNRIRSSQDTTTRLPRILVLPGSRNVEVARLLPIFNNALSLVREQAIEFEVGIVVTETVRPELYEGLIGAQKKWESHDIQAALDWADMSVAASGTVTLTTGLFQVPTVVGYQVSLFTEFVLGMLIPYKGFVSLTNIILGKKVFPEFINHRCDRYNISRELIHWLKNHDELDRTLADLKSLPERLTGDDFNVSEYMAEVIK